MAHFYASIQGARGEATRCGDKGSGITGHVRGWSIGARVDLLHDKITGVDTVRVYKTNGSNGYSNELIAQFDTDGKMSVGTGTVEQRLRDAFAAALAAGVDVWPIITDGTFTVRSVA